MKIVADANIPFVNRAFGEFGTVQLELGREIHRTVLIDASVLLVRSVTKVNKDLLDGTSVKFVGSATIGTDHIDTGYLRESGIGFASAPGSNARSVAEYVVAALLSCSRTQRRPLAGLTLGIVGVGCVGTQVLRLAQALGLRTVLNDPPLQNRTGAAVYRPLHEVLSESDVVTLHVPLTDQGSHPTTRLVDQTFLSHMKPGAFLLNTSRGKVVDETALRALRRRLGAVVLDVWDSEPQPALSTIACASIATPHIAGYSLDGKVQGTQMIYDAACQFFFRKPSQALMADSEVESRTVDLGDSTDPLYDAVMHSCPILDDDALLRGIAGIAPAQRAAFYDGLRSNYRKRLEFRHYTVRNAGNDRDILASIGFTVA